MKTFYIKTLGCKVNQYDSQEIRSRFLDSGMSEVSESVDADVNIVNTCCVTHNADRKSRNAISSVVRSKKGGAKVVVVGCYTSYDRQAIENIKGVDVVFENSVKDKFFDWAKTFGCKVEDFLEKPLNSRNRTRAFLKIQDGCDNRCSYCIVPFVRGPSISRDFVSIINEAKHLVEAGHKEIILTGVCLGSFGKKFNLESCLVDIIEKLEQIKGLSRIRLSSIEPQDVTDRLIAKMADSEKLCPHLHIPFQSGDDDILRDMNKRLMVKDYLTIIENAKKNIKDLSITCDIIVGFPSENEINFRNTLEFLKLVRPLKTHIFTYSKRRGVLSAQKVESVSSQELKGRLAEIRGLSERLSSEYLRCYEGKVLNVLFEGKSWGYAENYIKVGLEANLPLANVLAMVKVTEIREGCVVGYLVDST